MDLKEVRRLIIEAVGRLPAQRRRIYQMSRDEEMKIPEIAERLGISPNTVKNTLVVSLGFIRHYLAERGHEL
jgi:RNA polymerase sigma-70 factor (ECF subfamily)